MTLSKPYDNEPFSGQLAIECLLVENEFLNDLLDRYGQERGEKIKPALVTVNFVWAVLALRTFYKSEYKLTCVNETYDQIAKYTGLGIDAIQNALSFLTWAGYGEKIRQGGGVNKLATVRKVYSTTTTQRDIPRLDTREQDGNNDQLNGNKDDLDGNKDDLDGNKDDLDGVLPVTPSVYQVINQDINQASNENLNKIILFGDISVRTLIPHQDDPAPNDIAQRMAMEQAFAQIAADKAERQKRKRHAPTS